MIAVTRTPCDEGVVRATPCASPCAPASAPWILAATVIASSMAFIDGTVVNVALPALQREFDADIGAAQWVIESFSLLLAALLLVGGAAGDRYGRRRVFLWGTALFALASAWCGLAHSIGELIAARAGQGIGAALMVPGSLAIIGASFSKKELGGAIGIWSGATAVTGALGPLLGGWLIDQYSWRAAFFINLPLALFVLVAAFRHVTESRNRHAGDRLDWRGAAAATLGLGALVYGLIESSTKGWMHPAVIAALVLGILLIAAFFAMETRIRTPMVPLALFRSKTFLGANVLTLLLYAALGGSLFFLPLNLVQIQHYSATAAGAALLPFILVMAAFSRRSGAFADRHGARRSLIVGPLVAALGFLLFAIPETGGTYWLTFFPAVAVLGIGMAIAVAPLTTTVLNSVPGVHEGTASGVNNAASRIAAVVSIALFGVIFTSVFESRLTANLRHAEIPPALQQSIESQRTRLGAIDLPPAADAPARAAANRAIATSFVSGFRAVMLVSALLALLSGIVAFLTIEDNALRNKSAT